MGYISDIRNGDKNPKTQAVYNSECKDTDPALRDADLQTSSVRAQRRRSVLKGGFLSTPSFSSILWPSLRRGALED